MFQEYSSVVSDSAVHVDEAAKPAERHADLVDQHHHGRATGTEVTNIASLVLFQLVCRTSDLFKKNCINDQM